jgi:ribosomal peptide maturation radical SAM protein 1
MIDVVLVSMPFGPLLSPSLGLSLLQPQVRARGLSCRIEYMTLAFAERIGRRLYSQITSQKPSMTRAFAGEWIFSHALYDWPPEKDERYLAEVLLKPPLWVGRNRTKLATREEVRAILDAARLAPAFIRECADRLLESEPRIVGFTSVFQQHLASLALARQLKRRRPDITIVMGGANCEAAMGAETVRQFPFVDAAVSGEADFVFADLATRTVNGEAYDDLPGVLTRPVAERMLSSGCTPKTSSVKDLDALPFPDYADYFDQFERTRFARDWQPSVFVETSRGCWWGERMHCTFCGLNGATMAYRSKSAPRAIDELAHLAAAHPGADIQVVDNILDLKYFKTLLPDLAKRKLGVSLFYETKSNLKKDQIRLLRDAGVTTIQPGIESFSDPVLKLMKKGVSGLQNIQLLKWCKEIGVRPLWNFLIGFPGEAAADYLRMRDLTPRVCHLPCPTSVSSIRLDRFSPNFNQSDRFGFTKVRPLPFYDFIYDVPDHARRNLAYYFAFDYKAPQELVRYAEPFIKSVRTWRSRWRHTELVSVDLDDRLLLLDTRPRAAARVTHLAGDERAAYLACDAITDASQLDASMAAHLPSLAARGLMLNDGSRYLSLAIPVGDYQPSRPALARLRPLFKRVDARDRARVRAAFHSPRRQDGKEEGWKEESRQEKEDGTQTRQSEEEGTRVRLHR